MCTLSWQIHENHLNIVFNRDELLSRQKAAPPKVELIRDTAVLSPTDPEGGGTWIAANERGMVFCLLNHYKSTPDDGHFKFSSLFGMKMNNRRHPIDGKTVSFSSRGLLVREISTASGLFELRQILKNRDLFRYQPFLLVVFQGVQPPLQWLWNGQDLEELIAPLPVTSTSSLLPSFTERMRLRIFRKATDGFLKSLSDNRQMTLHCTRHPWLSAFSIAMRRKDKGTVSLTRIRLDADTIHMTYQPGDPATTRETGYEHQLPSKPGNVALSITGTKNQQDKRAAVAGERYGLHTNDNPGKMSVTSAAQTDTFSSDRYITNRIDINKIIHDKNPELARKLPRWTIGLIKLLARETSVNGLLNNLQHVSYRNFAPTVLNHLGVQGRVTTGSSELPQPDKRPVFLASHPTGGIDGLLLLSWLLNHYTDIRLVVTDILWEIPHLRPYVVPVDRYRKSRQSVDLLMCMFESDTPLLIFPAGVTARKINGRMQEASWQKMPVKLARQTDRCIVPVHIDGYNSGLFYGLARLRRLAGIKLNLEMLLLVREFFNPACRMFSITSGPAFTRKQILSLGKNDIKRAAALQHICEELPENFRSVPASSMRISKTVAT